MLLVRRVSNVLSEERRGLDREGRWSLPRTQGCLVCASVPDRHLERLPHRDNVHHCHEQPCRILWVQLREWEA